MSHRAARAVLVLGMLGGCTSAALVVALPGASLPAAAIQHEPTTEAQETTTTTTTEQESTTTTTTSPVPTTENTTTTTSVVPTTASPTTAPPTTEAPPDTEPPPPPPPPTTTTTEPPPPPPPEDRTPPRQPGQAPVPQDDPRSQVLTNQGADIHAVFPLLSVGGFAALGGLIGAQWYLTKPDRRGRRTL